ncbi:4Fe-4S dicluster domain-containing protein [Reyranella sp.]|uniref:4Fe-4S dicluster domain-containing protein n=1 Tax=Reyranella sp. TaxID=1929291 RepID=UPI002F9417A1
MDREARTPPHIDRRSLLRAMAASLALASAAGRRARADERALPYVNAPEFVVPGKPKWYATAVGFSGCAQPVLGKTYVGRPVKLEGNADHPLTGGATDVFMQAALLGLYDPARSQAPQLLGQAATWAAFDAAVAGRRLTLEARQGEGLRLLTGAVSSPTLLRQISDLLRRWPKARWHVSEPLSDANRQQAAQTVFGRRLDQLLRLDEANVVVSLDDDFLGAGPRQAPYAHRWSKRRLAWQQGQGASQLHVAESSLTTTGSMADHRLTVSPSRIGLLVAAIAQELGVGPAPAAPLAPTERTWTKQVMEALRASHGSSVVTVGAAHAPDVHAVALLINERLGAHGNTLTFIDPITSVPAPDDENSVAALAGDMNAGRVSTLVMLEVNPAYATPAGLAFRQALEKVEFTLHAGLYVDETARLSHWHVPLQHDLESWTDACSVDGTVCLTQPLIRPFYDVRSLHAVLDRWAGDTRSDHDLVRATWRHAWGSDFDDRWRDSLVRGFVADSAPTPVLPTIANRNVSIKAPTAGALMIDIRPDPTIWDGRFANNAWLQETPKPISKVTWGNVVVVSPRLAAERRISRGDELRLEANGRSITGAAWIAPGQDDKTLTVTLGYGADRTGPLPHGLGYDAFALCNDAGSWVLDGARLGTTGKHLVVASTQLHQEMDGFDFVRRVDRADRPVKKHPEAASFYPERKWDSPSWGMSVDLDLCIGCNACMVACMAENNVPVVGKELVEQGRQMHWLRVDHYFEGDANEPSSSFQPVPCMHCEQAPCEMGCPVNATVHSHDGLNLQVYNRCVGTRTCASYCPYKVRRFNWFENTGDDPEQLRAMRNPDVTVRSRGVMEKCTYCVQRISAARIASQIAGHPIRDGDVVTACQQACPTQAIVFGDVTDRASAVSRRKASPRDYSLLEEANTRPRTTYLARVRADRRPS